MTDIGVEEPIFQNEADSKKPRIEYKTFDDVPILKPDDFKENCGLPPETRAGATENFFLEYLGKVMKEKDVDKEIEFYNGDILKAAKALNEGKLNSWNGYESWEVVLDTLGRISDDFPNFTLFRGTDFWSGSGFRGMDYSPNAEEAIGFAVGHRIRREPVLVMINVKKFVEAYKRTTVEGFRGIKHNDNITFRTEGNWWRHSFEILIDPEIEADLVEVRRIPLNTQEFKIIEDRYKEVAIPIKS